MLWLLPMVLASGPASVSPVDNAAQSIIGYITGFGCLGVVALAFAWLLLKGWRLVSPAGDGKIRDQVRSDARADLEKELERVIAEKRRAEEQRDEALKIAQTQIVPILGQFTTAAAALIPLLQELVRREGGTSHDPARRR